MAAYDPRLSHFDLDLKRGAQAELWVGDICKMMAGGTGEIEVKRDSWFPQNGRVYVERECRHRDGAWRPSGIEVTKAKLWAFVAGSHPLILILATDWLKRARDRAAAHRENQKECKYGENPTRGTLVYVNHVIQSRDVSLDEHATSLMSLPA